ncbi:MAG: lipid-binding SYLF domain-containing protein [Nitrospinota bacterium]|nr:lipid-binding SYLF domain-containing protein [Nitrospinota bacterium]
MKILSSLLGMVLLFSTSTFAADESSQQILLKDSRNVIEEIMSTPDLQIPSGLISKAKAIIIFPSMLKGGFFVGARYGKGVATVRDAKTGQWGPPSFITTLGGSLGFQFGAQSVDMILIVMTERGIRGLLEDNFTLGGDIAVTAGPVGRYAELGVDIMLQGDMYSYSRSKGLFGGVSLKGTVIKPNVNYNREYYKAALTPQEIMMDGKVKRMPESSQKLIKYMNQIAPPKRAVVQNKEWMGWTENPKYGFTPQPKVMAQNTVPLPEDIQPAPETQQKQKKISKPLW